MLFKKYQVICGLMVNVRRSSNSWKMEINQNRLLKNCIKIKIVGIIIRINKHSNKEVQIIKSDRNSNSNNNNKHKHKYKYKSKVIKVILNRNNNHKHKHITD